jgi:hypothetical protein
MLMSGDERFVQLHNALHDDVYRNVLPGTLCRKFGVWWLDLMNLWHSYTTHLGLIIYRTFLHVAEDSMSRQDACPSCDGIGYVVLDSLRFQCVSCDGVGRVRVPTLRVVTAFTSISSALIRDPTSGEKPTVFLCTDDDNARTTVIALAKEIGFDGVDAGRSDASRNVENLGLLVGHLAYVAGYGNRFPCAYVAA